MRDPNRLARPDDDLRFEIRRIDLPNELSAGTAGRDNVNGPHTMAPLTPHSNDLLDAIFADGHHGGYGAALCATPHDPVSMQTPVKTLPRSVTSAAPTTYAPGRQTSAPARTARFRRMPKLATPTRKSLDAGDHCHCDVQCSDSGNATLQGLRSTSPAEHLPPGRLTATSSSSSNSVTRPTSLRP